MTDERLSEIERARMSYVSLGDMVPGLIEENNLRLQWAGYRDELLAEVKRLRGAQA